MEKKPSVRLHWLDWLRMLAILFVFIYHSTRFFNMEDWHVKNPIWYPCVEVWNGFAGTWMMPLIFVISGASLFYAVGKRGAGTFVKDRALRLLVPLLVGDFTHASLQVYLERHTHGQFSGSYFEFLPHYFQGFYEGGNPAAGNFALTGMHLWYLWWLFLFSILLYPLLRWFKGKGQGVLSRIGEGLALPGAVYALALPTVLLLVLVNPDSPVMAMKEGGWSLVIYLWILLCGFLLVSHEHLQDSIRKLRWVSLALAVFVLLCGGLVDLLSDEFTFGTLPYILFLTCRGLSSWLWILAFMGLGMQYLDFSNPFLKYANEGVLPFYILHQTVLLSVGYFVVQWAIPGLLKWVIILLVSFAVIMALYEFVVRRFNVMRFLFGMRLVPKKPATQPEGAKPAG